MRYWSAQAMVCFAVGLGASLTGCARPDAPPHEGLPAASEANPERAHRLQPDAAKRRLPEPPPTEEPLPPHVESR